MPKISNAIDHSNKTSIEADETPDTPIHIRKRNKYYSLTLEQFVLKSNQIRIQKAHK